MRITCRPVGGRSRSAVALSPEERPPSGEAGSEELERMVSKVLQKLLKDAKR